MKDFIAAHQQHIDGVLGCFDRLIFRGYLPLQDGYSMAQFLNRNDVRFRHLKSFLFDQARRIKSHAQAYAEQEGRPFEYLTARTRMETQAREWIERDHIGAGLVGIFSVLEPCRSFSFRFEKGRPFVQSARRKCLVLYYYFLDQGLGLVHVKVQTWFPMVIQIYVNGHEWLARKLDANDVGYSRIDNVFTHIDDVDRAQAFSDRFASLDWPKILETYAHKVNPMLDDLLHGHTHYWVVGQSEYATDVMFKSRAALKDLYPHLISHCLRCFGAREIMGFLGRKLHGKFEGELITDLLDLWHLRIPGMRIKHRVQENWLKMYDKAGRVIRIETVINNPNCFRVRRSVHRKGEPTAEWVPMRKGVAYLFRYRDISCSANSRYLDALAIVTDPSAKVRELDRITRRVQCASGRTAKAFNPLARDDRQLFRAVLDGADCLQGFTNRDVRARLRNTCHLVRQHGDPKRESAKVSRILHRFHAHGLIAKFPHSRRWRPTRRGRRLMATAIQVGELNFPQLLALAP